MILNLTNCDFLQANQVKISRFYLEIHLITLKRLIKTVFNKNAKYFNIPGFRKGKAPMNIVEKYYGSEIFYEDTFNEIVPAIYDEAVKEEKLEVVSRPEIDIVQIGKGKDLIFTAVVSTKPEVKLGKYKGIEIKKIEYTVKVVRLSKVQPGHTQQKFVNPVRSGRKQR